MDTTPCPAEAALDLVASKWVVHVIFQLHHGEVMRFRELQRAIGGITQKELTKQLRRLEEAGLIARRAYPEVPPRVEYRLTTLGATLVEPLSSLSKWSERYGERLAKRRRA